MQGDNPTYSAGNIALAMLQNEKATIFGTRERWKTLNRSVIDTEANKGMKIFARSTLGKGYSLSDAYDLSQTQGRELKHFQLQDDTKEMENALATLLNYAVVPVNSDPELEQAAFYDMQEMALYNRGVNNHFAKIHTLEPGDRITLTTKLGTRSYSVISVEKISENDTSDTAATTDNRITLFTCVRDQREYRWCVKAVEV